MKPLKLFALLFAFYFIACANKQAKENNETNTVADTSVAVTPQQKDSFATGQIINNIICKTDASQSFALYIPPKFKTNSLPVIYFFDPHADGELPLKNYKALADKYGFILIGSNNSKNGNDWQTTENIWNNLFNDTKSRLP